MPNNSSDNANAAHAAAADSADRHRVARCFLPPAQRAFPAARSQPDRKKWRNTGAAGPQRRRKIHGAETDQPHVGIERRRNSGRRPIDDRLGSDRTAAPHRLRHSGNRPVPALHGRAEYFAGSAPGKMARGSHPRARDGINEAGRFGLREIFASSSARTFGRPAPTRWHCARAGRRSAHFADGRAVRRA